MNQEQTKQTRSKLPSAVFIGLAGDDAELTREQRAALEACLAADTTLPKPELSLDVPSGLVLCFDYPARTLELARRLGASARRTGWPLPPLRMGAHVSTVISESGASDTTTSTGSMDGAMRVARLAGPNQALSTPAFRALIVQQVKTGTEHFRDLGELTGKNGRAVQVFEIVPFSR